MQDNYQLLSNILKETVSKDAVKKIGTGVLWGTGLAVGGAVNQMGVDTYNKMKMKMKIKQKKKKQNKKPKSN